MKQLIKQLSQLEKALPQFENKDEKISQVNVGWHLEHSLLVINSVVKALRKSEPSKFKKKFNLSRLIVFTLGFIPRGKGKAPEIVSPTTYDLPSLEKQLHKSKAYVEALKDVENDRYFRHAIFGHLRKEDAIRFLEIHTNHHLKVIQDIIDR